LCRSFDVADRFLQVWLELFPTVTNWIDALPSSTD
jgi:hypothetical protein